jgi:hypothetical protein
MKMRAAHLGKPLSAEHAQKIAMAHTGKKQDAATRARISAALLLVDRPLRRCDDCGLESLPAALGHHQSRKGHSGYTEVVKIV